MPQKQRMNLSVLNTETQGEMEVFLNWAVFEVLQRLCLKKCVALENHILKLQQAYFKL